MRFFNHYVSFYDALAGPWNLSPECLYFMYRHRRYFRSILSRYFGKSSDIRVCNVGIGLGDWDLYLSFELGSKGKLTSIDIQSDSCEILEGRLEIQKHPHKVEVVNEDVNKTSLHPENKQRKGVALSQPSIDLFNPYAIFPL